MARQGDAPLARHAGEVAELLEAELGRLLLLAGDARGLLLAHLVAHRDGAAPDLQVAVLALARCVVHEGELVDLAGAQVALHLVDQAHVVDLEAQVQAVADEVGVRPLGALGLGDERHEALGVVPLAHGLHVHDVAPVGGKRVEHRGDAVGKQLALRLEQRRREVHEDRGARADDGLDVVGVDVHEAGHDVAAVGVDDARVGALGVDRALALDGGDAVALDHELVAKEQPVRLNNDTVPDDVQGCSNLTVPTGSRRFIRRSDSPRSLRSLRNSRRTKHRDPCPSLGCGLDHSSE